MNKFDDGQWKVATTHVSVWNIFVLTPIPLFLIIWLIKFSVCKECSFENTSSQVVSHMMKCMAVIKCSQSFRWNYTAHCCQWCNNFLHHHSLQWHHVHSDDLQKCHCYRDITAMISRVEMCIYNQIICLS